jgi:hypothetical protein
MPLNAHISMESGPAMTVAEGSRLVFGRGPGVDLAIAAGRGLSRRAGVVTAMPAGVWIANISRTHALYVEGAGYRIRLPRMEEDGEPADGWFVRSGTAYVGSRAMLDERQPLAVTVTPQDEEWPTGERRTDGAIPILKVGPAAGAGHPDGAWQANGSGRGQPTGPAVAGRHRLAAGAALPDGADMPEGTLLPFNIDPMTKLFLVALLWCQPWLLDPSATRPLPRTPEIARGALEVTGAYRELERFDSNPEFRDVLSARVAEHIKVLRRKITDHGLAGADVRLSDEVAVRILIDHGIITSADLARMDDPKWRSRQEDLWWTRD